MSDPIETYSDWTAWSACNAGKQTRTRTCTQTADCDTTTPVLGSYLFGSNAADSRNILHANTGSDMAQPTGWKCFDAVSKNGLLNTNSLATYPVSWKAATGIVIDDLTFNGHPNYQALMGDASGKGIVIYSNGSVVDTRTGKILMPPNTVLDGQKVKLVLSIDPMDITYFGATPGTGNCWQGTISGLTILGNAPVTPIPAPIPPVTPTPGIDKKDVTIVANMSDPSSAAMAIAYATAWGIDTKQIITLDAGSAQEATAAHVDAMRVAVNAAGRQYTVLAMAFPSRCNGQSITSAITFGRRDRTQLTPNILYGYTGLKPYIDRGVRPAMMLISANYIHAGVVLDHGTSYLMLAKDGDTAANSIRGNTRAGQNVPGLITWDARNNPNVGPGANVCSELSVDCAAHGYPALAAIAAGYQSSYQLHSDAGTPFLPGWYGDHITSYGGVLEGYAGQTQLTWELDRGACASCGTVEEPGNTSMANITRQFVNVTVFDPLFRSNVNVGIACWASIACADRTLIAGDLLFQASFAQ